MVLLTGVLCPLAISDSFSAEIAVIDSAQLFAKMGHVVFPAHFAVGHDVEAQLDLQPEDFPNRGFDLGVIGVAGLIIGPIS